MSTIRFVARHRACTVLALAGALAACSGGNGGNGTAPEDGGSDATAEAGGGSDAGQPQGQDGSTDAGSGGDTGGESSDATADSNATADTGADANAEAATDAATDAGTDADDDAEADGGTEPSYLRNDAISGFSFTNNFGTPYDSILAAPLNTTQSAITGGQIVSAPSQLVNSETFTLVANNADIYTALNISASLSASTGLASVNAKTQWATSQQIDTTDLTVLVDLQEAGGAQELIDPTLTPAAAALTPEQFFALYGDRYAAEITTGAEMYCLLTVQTYSEQDKSSLTASLGFSYGASNVSTSFTSTAQTTLASHNVDVSCQYLGYTPKTAITSLSSLLTAANDFYTGQAGTIGNVGTSTLSLLYTSYYGVPGYPGVPAGTAARVVQQAQAAADYLLYQSLVNRDFADYFGSSTYSGLGFFVDMKAFYTASSQYMTAALANSQDPGVAVPTPAADALLSNWKTTPSAASTAGATPSFQTYVLANGIVPMKVSDYDIPLRYAYPDAAGNGTLNGTEYIHTQLVPAVSLGSTTPVNYQLYLINRASSGGGISLEYIWDTGYYFFNNVTGSNGQPEASLVSAAISSFGLTGNLQEPYVVVNKANGLVLTDMGTSVGMDATHFASSASQYWSFYVDSGSKNCSSYVSGGTPSSSVYCTVDGNYPGGACGSGIYAISGQDLTGKTSGYWNVNGSNAVGTSILANGTGGCGQCNHSCSAIECADSSAGGGPSPWDIFFLQAYDGGTTHAIYNYAGTAGLVISPMVTDPTVTGQNTPTPGYGNPSLEEAIEVGGNTGQSNELWVFIPQSNVDSSAQ
jgi:hypothetical protein